MDDFLNESSSFDVCIVQFSRSLPDLVSLCISRHILPFSAVRREAMSS